MSDHIKTDLAECLRIEAALTTDPHTRTRLQAYIAEAQQLLDTHPQPVTPADSMPNLSDTQVADGLDRILSDATSGHVVGITGNGEDALRRASAIIRRQIPVPSGAISNGQEPVTPAGGEVCEVVDLQASFPACAVVPALPVGTKLYTHPPVADAALSSAYDVGWIECTNWAKRDDLVSDMDSQAYAEDRARNLAALNQRGGDRG